MDWTYLDNNATTRPAPEVVSAMLPYLEEWYGNASSVHRFGQRARHAVDDARAQVASLLGCAEGEILFTGGGTESINTAIRSLLLTRAPRRKVITTSVEHSATRELCRALAKDSIELVELDVDNGGALDLDQLQAALDDQTAMVSIMWANNETGVLFPVDQIAALCQARRIPFHCDGTQAVGKIPVDVKAAGMDLMSFAAHKFHGPKGVGGLYARRGMRIRPLIVGGPQEQSRRGGTENVPALVGMGTAAALVEATLGSPTRAGEKSDSPNPRATQVSPLRDQFEQAILDHVPDTFINGRKDCRLPNTSNIGFARLEAEAILLLLSEKGICASAGAACSSGSLEPSHVLRAMGVDEKVAHGAIRFSLSRYTTQGEIDRALSVIPPVIARLREVLPVGT